MFLQADALETEPQNPEDLPEAGHYTIRGDQGEVNGCVKRSKTVKTADVRSLVQGKRERNNLSQNMTPAYATSPGERGGGI